MKTTMVILWLCLVFAAVLGIFWYNEWKYQLPTEVPAGYVPIANGTTIDLPDSLNTEKKRPVFVHFFNPDCPCSRFNMPHFKSLVKQFGSKVDFAIVVMNNEKYSAKRVKEKYDINVPVIFDTSLAEACGVYSTPQAVILTSQHQLYYRGNYNKSRYCTDAKTNYAQIAITELLNNQRQTIFDRYALTAYGCELPTCNK